MDSARSAVNQFLHKKGHKDTTVHETVAPAVTHETVNPHRHEEVTTAVDKEVHQDHYHTSVQPVHLREEVPEIHKHNLTDVKHVNLDHDNNDHNRQRLQEEAAKYKDESVVADTRHTTSKSPTVAGEHVHHHVHETIQPVIHKETVQPTVTHTTVPIHETHHNAAQHHSSHVLPAVTMDEFKRSGGGLEGRQERFDQFDGVPKAIGGSGINNHDTTGRNPDACPVPAVEPSSHTSAHQHGGHGGHVPATEPVGHNRGANTAAGVSAPGSATHHHNSAVPGATAGTASVHNHHNDSHSVVSDSSSTKHKPSLMEKLDPRIDSNGDGKKGFFS